ncbi:MAG: tRNA1(Val) (adenine(37)-N6)-methyltransferase [bacterium]
MTFSLWPEGPRLTTKPGVMPLTTDSVLLADFVRPRGKRFLDLGSGTGFLAVSLLWRYPGLRADLVDISAEAAALGGENLAANGLAARGSAVHADVRSLTGRYDFIVTNPPYYPPTGGLAGDAGQQKARLEGALTLAALAETAARLLGSGGKLFLVYPAARLGEALRLFPEFGLEPKRLRLVQRDERSRPSVFLLELSRSARPGLIAEPTLLLKTPAGEDTEEAKRIYKL